MLVTVGADDLLPTIRSRCQRIDFDPVADDALQPHSSAKASTGRGRAARGRARGRPARPRPGARRPARSAARRVRAAPARVDGTGATALAIAEELDAAVDAARRRVARSPRDELAEFDAEMERLGYADRDAQRMRRRIEERHKREARRARIDLLLEGVTAIESVYRDALAAPAPALNADRPPLVRPACGGRRARRVPRGARGVPDQREGDRALTRAAALASPPAVEPVSALR